MAISRRNLIHLPINSFSICSRYVHNIRHNRQIETVRTSFTPSHHISVKNAVLVLFNFTLTSQVFAVCKTQFLPTSRNACKVWVASSEVPRSWLLLFHGTATRMMLTRMEARGTVSDRRSTETSGVGRQNCVAVARPRLQTPQLRTGASVGTGGTKTIPSMTSMPPYVHSPQQVSTPREWHSMQMQPRRSWNVLLA